ncbi:MULTISPECIES: O-antigen ligase family protein [unclassified Lysobacter]|uniref:O-antigen ligase family protein n=1 Tax=unclassified Lysobacter TaxID=2635362 RepID=UPI0006F7381D|nr:MULTISPECIES: O-antigen ligase family protein [unclassified Lysobacter]KRC33789.1 hypothetical protein ASE10_12620 [Lysobacter sp. Root76]KRD69126.1 hypothetical protein ASE45_08070 [Lysobacter sp. Root96]
MAEHATAMAPVARDSDARDARATPLAWYSDTAAELPPWLRRAALLALAYQAFFALTDIGLYLRPELGAGVLLLLLCCAGRRPWRELSAQPAVRALALLIAFLIAQAVYAAVSVAPAIPLSAQLSTAGKLVRLALFTCVIGWWLSLMPRAIPRLVVLMGAGLLLSVLIYLPWTQGEALWAGRLRADLGIPENLTGQLAAVGGWLALCLLMALWAQRREPGRRALLAIGFLAYAGCFCLLLFSQSRGAWLAFAAVTPPVVLAYAWHLYRRGGARAIGALLPVLAAALVSVLLLFAARDLISSRFAGSETVMTEAQQAADAGTVAIAPTAPAAGAAKPADAAAAQQTQINNKAVSVRMALYRLGVEKWLERPLLGWGLRTTPSLIADSRRDMAGQHHMHLHNTYLDALVGLGTLGTGLLALAFALVLREALLAWRRGWVPVAGFWALIGSVGIVLVANNFDSLLWRFEYGRAPLEFLFGTCLAWGLIRRRGEGGRGVGG